eukprot:143586_1
MSLNPPHEYWTEEIWARTGGRPVKLGSIIRGLVSHTYAEFHNIAERLENESDSERRKRLFAFIDATRQRLIRLLVLVRWADTSKNKFWVLAQIMQILDGRDQTVKMVVDQLKLNARLLQERLYPMSDVPTALHILSSGSYRLLPRVIEESVPFKKSMPSSQVASTMLRLNSKLRMKLLQTEIPSRMRVRRVENGMAYIEVEDEFEIGVSLRMDPPGEAGGDLEYARIKWALFELRVCVSVHDEDSAHSSQSLLSTAHVDALKFAVNVQLKKIPAANALRVIYDTVHAFCLKAQFALLHVQARELKVEFSVNLSVHYLKFRELSISLWPDAQDIPLAGQLPSRKTNFSTFHPTPRSAEAVKREKICIKISSGRLGVLSVTHNPPLPPLDQPVGLSRFEIDPSRLDLSALVQRSVIAHANFRICQLCRYIEEQSAASPEKAFDSARLVGSCGDALEIGPLEGGPLEGGPLEDDGEWSGVSIKAVAEPKPIHLSVCLFASRCVSIRADTRTGHLDLEGDQGDLLVAAGRKVNADISSLHKVLVGLRYGAILDHLAELALSAGLSPFRKPAVKWPKNDSTGLVRPRPSHSLFLRLRTYPSFFAIIELKENKSEKSADSFVPHVSLVHTRTGGAGVREALKRTPLSVGHILDAVSGSNWNEKLLNFSDKALQEIVRAAQLSAPMELFKNLLESDGIDYVHSPQPKMDMFVFELKCFLWKAQVRIVTESTSPTHCGWTAEVDCPVTRRCHALICAQTHADFSVSVKDGKVIFRYMRVGASSLKDFRDHLTALTLLCYFAAQLKQHNSQGGQVMPKQSSESANQSPAPLPPSVFRVGSVSVSALRVDAFLTGNSEKTGTVTVHNILSDGLSRISLSIEPTDFPQIRFFEGRLTRKPNMIRMLTEIYWGWSAVRSLTRFMSRIKSLDRNTGQLVSVVVSAYSGTKLRLLFRDTDCRLDVYFLRFDVVTVRQHGPTNAEAEDVPVSQFFDRLMRWYNETGMTELRRTFEKTFDSSNSRFLTKMRQNGFQVCLEENSLGLKFDGSAKNWSKTDKATLQSYLTLVLLAPPFDARLLRAFLEILHGRPEILGAAIKVWEAEMEVSACSQPGLHWRTGLGPTDGDWLYGTVEFRSTGPGPTCRVVLPLAFDFASGRTALWREELVKGRGQVFAYRPKRSLLDEVCRNVSKGKDEALRTGLRSVIVNLASKSFDQLHRLQSSPYHHTFRLNQQKPVPADAKSMQTDVMQIPSNIKPTTTDARRMQDIVNTSSASSHHTNSTRRVLPNNISNTNQLVSNSKSAHTELHLQPADRLCAGTNQLPLATASQHSSAIPGDSVNASQVPAVLSQPKNMTSSQTMPSSTHSVAATQLVAAPRLPSISNRISPPLVQPIPSNMQPVPSNMQPMPSNMQPMPSNMQPMPSNMQPMPSNMQPMPSNMQPMQSNIQPMPLNNTLVMPSDIQMMASNTQMLASNMHSRPSNMHSMLPNMLSMPSTTQPMSSKKQPIHSNMQPMPLDMQPITSNVQSVPLSMQPMPSMVHMPGIALPNIHKISQNMLPTIQPDASMTQTPGLPSHQPFPLGQVPGIQQPQVPHTSMRQQEQFLNRKKK